MWSTCRQWKSLTSSIHQWDRHLVHISDIHQKNPSTRRRLSKTWYNHDHMSSAHWAHDHNVHDHDHSKHKDHDHIQNHNDHDHNTLTTMIMLLIITMFMITIATRWSWLYPKDDLAISPTNHWSTPASPHTWWVFFLTIIVILISLSLFWYDIN